MMKKIKVHKIASIAVNLNLKKEITISDKVVPKAGSILAVRALEEKNVYNQIEIASGRMVRISKDDLLVVALGARKALKGFVGRVPSRVKAGDKLDILNLGGVVGICESVLEEYGKPIKVEVLGSVIVQGNLATTYMNAIKPVNKFEHSAPLIIVSGTSMNTGKTTAACELIQQLSKKNYKIAAAKLTGVSLLSDTLNMEDNGAEKSLSFIHAGLTSTINNSEIVSVAKGLLCELNKINPDIIVVELGDGIMGEYGVKEILHCKDIMKFAKAHIVCALDPVGAWGAVQQFKKFGLKIDLLTGPASGTSIGVEIIKRETGIETINAKTEPAKFASFIEQKIIIKK
ncbi:hypothetical protein HYY70_01595 [Candidatus Woesearchaeota archaeon]|nr:hypothetical protein [Candidatus Woesearchaeota archaeon]